MAVVSPFRMPDIIMYIYQGMRHVLLSNVISVIYIYIYARSYPCLGIEIKWCVYTVSTRHRAGGSPYDGHTDSGVADPAGGKVPDLTLDPKALSMNMKAFGYIAIASIRCTKRGANGRARDSPWANNITTPIRTLPSC
jgi:hypothetical protein